MPMLSALSINKSLAIVMATLAVGAWCGNSYAQDKPASFNSSFLMGSARDMDTSLYSHGNPVSPGEYRLDMYVNGQWFGKQDIVFKSVPGEKAQKPALALRILSSMVSILNLSGRQLVR